MALNIFWVGLKELRDNGKQNRKLLFNGDNGKENGKLLHYRDILGFI